MRILSGRGFGCKGGLILVCATLAGAQPVSAEGDQPGAAAQAAGTLPAWAAPAKFVDPPASAPASLSPSTPEASATPSAPAVDPVLDVIRRKLTDKAVMGKAEPDDAAALASFYNSRPAPLWLKNGAFGGKAEAVIAEIKKADDFGLEASAFSLPTSSAGASAEAQADAEVKLSLAAMKYARFARGGRLDPVSLSNILDMKPPVKDPKVVISELSESAAPESYLRGLHPKHAGFEALRQALLKARGPEEAPEKIDEALKVKLPAEGNTLKAGNSHADIALLRQRLKIEPDAGASEFLFDPKLEAGLKAWQIGHDMKDSGVLNSKARTALNREGEPKKVERKDKVSLILVNMERWRWLPEDLSNFYVMNNIPEFTSRAMKGGEEVLKQKIIVGQPTWPTPVLTASMEFVIFHPEWGVPDGIKVKELLPRLKRASAQYGGGFFDELFNGGGAGARVLAAYKLNPTLNGRPVDANKIDWNKVDIKQFSFVQPAGGENPLGLVKFRFPNRHDVYMHDTPQRALFAQSFRALSHGCMRLDQPRKLAEIIMAEDKGWSPDKVGAMMSGGGEVALSKPVPVYLTYFTARAGPDGKLEIYSDIYGHDDKLVSALAGHPVRYNPPDHSKEDFVAAGEPVGEPIGATVKKGKKGAGQAGYTKKASGDTVGDFIGNAFNGLLAN